MNDTEMAKWKERAERISFSTTNAKVRVIVSCALDGCLHESAYETSARVRPFGSISEEEIKEGRENWWRVWEKIDAALNDACVDAVRFKEKRIKKMLEGSGGDVEDFFDGFIGGRISEGEAKVLAKKYLTELSKEDNQEEETK